MTRKVMTTKIYTSLPGIRTRRRSLGLQAAPLAAALGISRSAWSQWESGETMPSAGYLPALAELLQCSIADLYGEEMDCAQRAATHGQCDHWPRNDGKEKATADDDGAD